MHNALLDGEELVSIKDYKDEYKGRVTCPLCEAVAIAKMGSTNAHHFAHKSTQDCDNWYDNSEFKQGWLTNFKKEHIEVTCSNEAKRHRADVKIGERLIIQFYNKSLLAEDWKERVDFYRQFAHSLIVVVDCRGKKINPQYITNVSPLLIRYQWSSYSRTILSPKGILNYYLLLQVSEDSLLLVDGNMNNKDWSLFNVHCEFTKKEFLEFSRRVYVNRDIQSSLYNTKFTKRLLTGKYIERKIATEVKIIRNDGEYVRLLSADLYLEHFRRLGMKKFIKFYVNKFSDSIIQQYNEDMSKLDELGKNSRRRRGIIIESAKKQGLKRLEENGAKVVKRLLPYKSLTTTKVKNKYQRYLQTTGIYLNYQKMYREGKFKELLYNDNHNTN